MKRKFVFALVIVTFAITTLTSLQAQSTNDIYLKSIWASACDETVTSVFITVENTMDQPIDLMSVQTPLTEAAYIVEDDETCGESLVDSMTIEAGESLDITLAVETDESLETGDTFSLTLGFEAANNDEETLTLITAVPVLEEAPEAMPLVVIEPWARPTVFNMAMDDEDTDMAEEDTEAMDMDDMEMGMGGTTAIYMRLLNQGEDGLTLVGGETDAAAVVEIHETRIENEVMQMRPLDGLELPVDEPVSLQPAGYHIMLIDLQRDLAEGDAITLTLIFEDDIEMTIAVPVYDAMMMGMEME